MTVPSDAAGALEPTQPIDLVTLREALESEPSD